MLIYLILVLLTLWTIGLASGNSFDGYIHLIWLVVLTALIVHYITDKELID